MSIANGYPSASSVWAILLEDTESAELKELFQRVSLSSTISGLTEHNTSKFLDFVHPLAFH